MNEHKYCKNIESGLSTRKDYGILSCVLWSDVLCELRKSQSIGIMEECLSCERYRRFEREMDQEDDRSMDEIDKIRKYGYPRRLTR